MVLAHLVSFLPGLIPFCGWEWGHLIRMVEWKGLQGNASGTFTVPQRTGFALLRGRAGFERRFFLPLVDQLRRRGKQVLSPARDAGGNSAICANQPHAGVP
jgi:hypothetical protein